MIFIDDSPESRASNTSLIFCFHNGILNTLNNVHNKKLGAMANSQLNLRLILDKVNINNIRKFREAIEKKIQAYDRELRLLAREQLAGEDNPEREIILYKFDEFSRQVIRDKYILSKFGAFISFVEKMKELGYTADKAVMDEVFGQFKELADRKKTLKIPLKTN